ncbi:MAG: DUF134 domain-containing protein [Bacteroidales bacterium]|nr:DUF134 domain-containing protein [Bacteroidales bacterium]
MPRPKNSRTVHEPPLFVEFKPTGIAGKNLEQRFLTLDEFEAVRLADSKGMTHEEASLEMDISRSTFSRLIDRARNIIATFLIRGQLLTIDGGNIHFKNNIIRCLDCGHMFKTSIDIPLSKCPGCSSTALENLAGGFGHGVCCTDRIHTQTKKGGQNAKR